MTLLEGYVIGLFSQELGTKGIRIFIIHIKSLLPIGARSLQSSA